MKSLDEIQPQDFWYLVGLITADGNLSKSGRHLCIVSKDTTHLINIKKVFGINAKIATKISGYNGRSTATFLQFGDVKLYRKLLEIGLMPNKSLILKKLRIPNNFFPDFLRGLIDGDGNIHVWRHPQNGGEQWELRIYSAAPYFSKWLFTRIENFFSVKGILINNRKYKEKASNPVYVIKFGKMAAREILGKCYYLNALALDRKSKLAIQCCTTYSGWSKSFTVQSQI